MTLLERIKELREAHGNISINRLEKEAGLTRGSMAKWDNHDPSYDKLKKVADYFGITVEYLLAGDAQNEKLTKQPLGEQIPGYEFLSEENKVKAQDYIGMLLKLQQNA